MNDGDLKQMQSCGGCGCLLFFVMVIIAFLAAIAG